MSIKVVDIKHFKNETGPIEINDGLDNVIGPKKPFASGDGTGTDEQRVRDQRMFNIDVNLAEQEAKNDFKTDLKEISQ